MTADERDSVQSVVDDLGLYGALQYAYRRLPQEPNHKIRLRLIQIIHVTAPRLKFEATRARRLARCHAIGLRQKGYR